MKATSFFLGGVLVVLIGWPIVGVVLEVYGFFLLFRGFFPVVVGFIRRIPVLGSILNLPFISPLQKVGKNNVCWFNLLVKNCMEFNSSKSWMVYTEKVNKKSIKVFFK
uniref:Golgi transport 1Bb n=1 Tax=Cyprinodon variegatus TaxID=28743 RepID=A0A3Q2E6I3_CYPVA